MRALTIVFAVAWTAVALLESRRTRRRAVAAAAPALGHAAAMWAPLAPLVLSGWAMYALTLPDGRTVSRARRVVLGLVSVCTVGWALEQAVRGTSAGALVFAAGALTILVVAVAAGAARYRHAPSVEGAAPYLWAAAGALSGLATAVVVCALHALTGRPADLALWVGAAALWAPLVHAVSLAAGSGAAAERAFTTAMTTAAVLAVAAACYLVTVGGISGVPRGRERTVLLAGVAAAAAAVVLAVPVRLRTAAYARSLLGRRQASTAEVGETFEARMTRAVPLDELLLQLAESLQASVPGTQVEIWTSAGEAMTRTISVPASPHMTLHLGASERLVLAHSRIGGPAWITVWLPDLHVDDHDERLVPIAHLGDLLGLLVVRRPAEATPFSDADESALTTVARKLGLALHNVRLDSALQASLAELAQRNAELQASRLRIVNAADATRREIERDLHDGAQQHLVSLAVKLGVAQQVFDDPVRLRQLLHDVHVEAQDTIEQLRELAHGVYPPLLRDRGLGPALDAAAGRSPIHTEVLLDCTGRYAEHVETAAYFCCLEAMQNAAKYAGPHATVRVSGRDDDGVLEIEVADDGVGFDVGSLREGSGFTNMRDRVGALGGSMAVISTPGSGTTVRLRIPASQQ
jgi:signal transduction histidine kinase